MERGREALKKLNVFAGMLVGLLAVEPAVRLRRLRKWWFREPDKVA
jgi:hypothetical protein